MKSILEELFYGHIFPFERIVPQDPGYRPINQKKPPFPRYHMLEQGKDQNGKN